MLKCPQPCVLCELGKNGMASSEARKQTFWESSSEDETVTSPTPTSTSFQATTTFQCYIHTAPNHNNSCLKHLVFLQPSVMILKKTVKGWISCTGAMTSSRYLLISAQWKSFSPNLKQKLVGCSDHHGEFLTHQQFQYSPLVLLSDSS